MIPKDPDRTLKNGTEYQKPTKLLKNGQRNDNNNNNMENIDFQICRRLCPAYKKGQEILMYKMIQYYLEFYNFPMPRKPRQGQQQLAESESTELQMEDDAKSGILSKLTREHTLGVKLTPQANQVRGATRLLSCIISSTTVYKTLVY